MRQFSVSGMSCAACSTRIEKAVSALEGVEQCNVSLLTNSMTVTGNADTNDIIEAIQNAGYNAAVKGEKSVSSVSPLKDSETPMLKKRLIFSLSFLVLLMYISMGHTMWSFPLPDFIESNYIALALIQLLLTVAVMVINQKFFINGFKGLINKAPNMDTLVSLGSTAAFLYSTSVLFVMTDAQLKGNFSVVMSYYHGLYFESAAMILALITLGKMLEARAKGKTTSALQGLMSLAPKAATLLIDGVETTTPIEQVKPNDIFVVRPGESIPVDGIVTYGFSAVNESALSGESIPVDKQTGDKVSAGTLNQSGYLKCKATRVGEDTTISQIIKMVSDAAATKAPIAKIADKVSGIFVPVVIAIAVITITAWLLADKSIGFALARGISVLVISCPCALGLATPVAIMVASGKGAKNGILFKTAVSLEETGKVNIIALDKTGTITKGEPTVTDILPCDISETELLLLAYSLENQSEHPLSKAIVAEGKNQSLSPFGVTDFKAMAGNGLTAVYKGKRLFGGNQNYISSQAVIPDKFIKLSEELAAKGKTPLFFSENNVFCGIIAVADTIKPESAKAIKQLKNMGIYVVMLTGDNCRTANAIGKQAGVDEVISELLPDGKKEVISKFKTKGKVAMVGDGINDAPALTNADIGIAIGAGSDIAIDTADIVLMKSKLTDLCAAIRLSRATLKIIHQNLFWAFIYNCLGIPLAAGLFIPLLGWELNPMFGAAAMSLSSFCVVSNALRLNFSKLFNPKRDKKIKHKEILKMQKTIKIEGMMCPHCSGRVKQVLEAIPQVESADVSHETGTALVTLSDTVDINLLKSTIEQQGYSVKEIV